MQYSFSVNTLYMSAIHLGHHLNASQARTYAGMKWVLMQQWLLYTNVCNQKEKYLYKLSGH